MGYSTKYLQGVGLEFQEPMSGFIGVGETDPAKGAAKGKRNETTIRFDVRITIADLRRFLVELEHEAHLSGTVTCEPLGGPFPIQNSRFKLFSINPSTGKMEMVYAFSFSASDGHVYYLYGQKEIYHDKGKFDVFKDMTRLFATVYRGESVGAPIYGAGILTFKIQDLPSMVASMKVIHTASWAQKLAGYKAFGFFVYHNLGKQYLKGLDIFYETGYENLALSGRMPGETGSNTFFLVSGVHDKGFPWGDGESFSDVLFAIGDGAGGYHRYAVTERTLEGLQLDIKKGDFHYRGPLHELVGRNRASFHEMRRGAPDLIRCEADLEIHFHAKAHELVPFPFPILNNLLRRLPRSIAREFRNLVSSRRPLGVYIEPHTVSVKSGHLSIKAPAGRGTEEDVRIDYSIDADKTFGEAERCFLRNVREPTMLYGYVCAIRPELKSARIQVHSGALRDERQNWTKDRLDKLVGSMLSRWACAEILLSDDDSHVITLARGREPLGNKLFRKLGDPVIEVNNDHYPTALFERRIIKVRDPSGDECLALEENMDLMRLEPINSVGKVTVASIRDDESKSAALDRVLHETDFDRILKERFAASGKARPEYSIVIKPNFMFAYNKRDRTTYTDPDLVGHLVRRLQRAGFENIAVVEAQSTYGEYFDKRSVLEVARYLGYDASVACKIIDMTEDADESRYLGPYLGFHPVSRAWRGADFRISFAKNKTHAYSYYTLTLKNIYGALPLANKFKEYHCDRDIYHTTIEYLSAFPVHFGLVDAYLSADGPFGIFADTDPNETCTIIGGEDLVAVDWVASTKMGIDPMISKYMRLAVETFGKPEIRLIGDASLYGPWLNVPAALALFTNRGLDANYHFGNLFYTASAQMDDSHFTHKSKTWHIRLLRGLTVPLRRTFFVRTGENPSLSNRLASWTLHRLGF
jgi:uncharacterized protein (DUF362 family)